MYLDCKFICLGAKEHSGHADPVSEIELFCDGVGLLGEQIFLEVDLQAVLSVLQHGKAGLPKAT